MLLEFPPSFGGVGPRENTHKSRSVVTQAGRQESAPVPGARGDSRALAQVALCRLRPRAVSQPVEDSLPHGDSLSHAGPGPPWDAVVGIYTPGSWQENWFLAWLCLAHCVT